VCLFDNGVGSNLGNTTISDDTSSFDTSKLVYNPGGDGSNSSTKADPPCTAPHRPHPISNSSSSLTCATAFSQMPQVKDYAATADNLPQRPVAQKAKAPVQGSNASGSAVTALSAVPMSPTLVVLLVGMGPLPPRPSHVPL